MRLQGFSLELAYRDKAREAVAGAGLTEEEINRSLRNLKIYEPVWDIEKRTWVRGEYYQRGDAIAKAQHQADLKALEE